MYANTKEVGSAESITTETNNDAGSPRLIIELPFEARRYEFSLPAGEESLDASNEDEVPVLRRVLDTFENEEIRTRSLPTVIKEHCIAQYGGVISRREWFSADGVLSPARESGEPETPAAADSAPVAVTDGGQEEIPFDGERSDLSNRERIILNAIEEAREEVGIIEAESLKFWPAGEYRSDDSDLVALSGNYPEVPPVPEYGMAGKPAYQVREEFDAALMEALPSGINIEHLGGMVTGFYGEPEAATDGGFEEIKISWSGKARARIKGYMQDFQSEESDLVLATLDRQKTNIVIRSPEEAEALRSQLEQYDSAQRVWMNGMQDKALRRIERKLDDDMAARGFEAEVGRFFGGYVRPEPEPEAVGGEEEPETDGGFDLDGEVLDAADLQEGDEVAVEYKSSYGNKPVKSIEGTVTEAGGSYAYIESGEEDYRLDIENEVAKLGSNDNPRAIGVVREIELDVDSRVPSGDDLGEFVSWADIEELDAGEEVVFTFRKWDYSKPLYWATVEEAGRTNSNAPYLRVEAERAIEYTPKGHVSQTPEEREFEEPVHFALSQRAAMRRFPEAEPGSRRSNIAHSERPGGVRVYRLDAGEEEPDIWSDANETDRRLLGGEEEPETDGGEVMTDGGSNEYEAGWSASDLIKTDRETIEFLIHRNSNSGAYLLRLPEGENKNRPEAAERYHGFGDDADFRGADLSLIINQIEQVLDGRRVTKGYGDGPIGSLYLDAETLLPIRINILRIPFVRDAWLRSESFEVLLEDWQSMAKGEALKRAGEGAVVPARFYVKGVGRIDGRLELGEVYGPEPYGDGIGGYSEGYISGQLYTEDGNVYNVSAREKEPEVFSMETVSRLIENLDDANVLIDWDIEPLGSGYGNLMHWYPLPSEEALSEETHARSSPEESSERYGSDEDDGDENGGERLMTDGGSVPNPEGNPDAVTIAFDILSNERRRMVLRFLDGSSEVTIKELTDRLARYENGPGYDSDERKRARVALYQTHLPKLDDAGVIEYDQSRGIIEELPGAESLRRYLPENKPISARIRERFSAGGSETGDVIMTDGGHETPESVGKYEMEANEPKGVAWSLPTGIAPDGEAILDDSVFTVTVWRSSEMFDYALRLRKGSESLSPFERHSPRPLDTFSDRREAIEAAVEWMRENQPGAAGVRADGGRDIPEVGATGWSSDGPGDELRACVECGTVNNLFVNPLECYGCGYRWGSGGEVLPDGGSDGSEPHPDDEGVEIMTDGGFDLEPGESRIEEHEEVTPDPEEIRENDARFRRGGVKFNDHELIRRVTRHRCSKTTGEVTSSEFYRCDGCQRMSRTLGTLLTWKCEEIPGKEYVIEETTALTDEAAVERAQRIYSEENAVPPGAKRIDNELWKFAATPDPARELIEELESMSGDAGYSGWSVDRAGWHDSGLGDGHLWVRVSPVEGMYLGGYPQKCGTYSVPNSVINAINRSRFYRVTSVKAEANSGVSSFRIEAEEDDRLVRLAMMEESDDR